MIRKSRNEWDEMVEIMAANHRAHAGHFSWETNRAIAEAGVLDDFSEALAAKGASFFTNARHRGDGNDPPDCDALDNNGNQIGIEITELVDPISAAAARESRPYEWKDWKQDLFPALEKLIRKKDSPKQLNGGPYSEYVIVIHTDEPWLRPTYVRRGFENHIFPATKLITRAYLLISYDPQQQRYPCIRLNVRGRSHE